MRRLGGRVNLVICQKSKIDDWLEHFKTHYPERIVDDLTDENALIHFETFAGYPTGERIRRGYFVGVINYDLIFRRPGLLKIKFNTVMLDESSMIQNERAKRTKAILKLHTDNVILLSGTPTGGKYERLYSQMKLLGWDISKTQYYTEFINTRSIEAGGAKIQIVTGYKNIGRLKRKMRQFGCNFLKTDEVFDLPSQTFADIEINPSKEYKQFCKTSIINVNGREMVGDTTLTEMLYQRQLCGAYSNNKLKAFEDLLNSTDDRLIVFYNFTAEFEALREICKAQKREISIVNGSRKDLTCYETFSDSVTLIQYQAGAMGLNLQRANKIIYYSPPLSSELYEQSKKRIHRIGQEKPCFYYRLICKNSIEVKIYETLEKRQDFTEKLFLKG